MVFGSLMRIETSHPMPGVPHLLEYGRVLVALPRHHARTARMERAARGRIERRGEIAFEQDAKPLLGGIRHGRGREEGARIRMSRVLVEVRGVRLLDDA